MGTKNELRDLFKGERQKLTPSQLQSSSEKISELILKNFKLEKKLCSLFLPIERQKEINTYQFLERARNLDVNFTVPKANFKTNELKHIFYTDDTTLEINEYGIPEPVKGRKIAADKHDFVFVPLLAADSDGNRVGYGKGFYDRFLAKCSRECKFIGLNLFEPVDKIEDIVVTDKKLDYLITPEKIYSFD